jgi:caffeoyl-CoA O-methyltransferase
MTAFDSKLDDYILNHTGPEDDVLRELNRVTNLRVMNPRMLSGHLQGKFLQMVSKMVKPKCILEIGTFTGYSAICLAQGLPANGILHTIEINDELEDIAREYFKKANIEGLIKLHFGNAIDIIPSMDVQFDLVFIDGEKKEYGIYYNLVFDKLRNGGFIIADNVLWNGKVVDLVENPDISTKSINDFNNLVMNDNRVENVLLPLRDGLMLIRKK